MVKENINYKKQYTRLIAIAKNHSYKLNKYHEIHHILPKSIGGTNEESNLIKLNYEDHFIAHKYLMFIFKEIDKSKFEKMSLAFHTMCSNNKGLNVTELDYKLAKTNLIETRIELYKSPMGICASKENRLKANETKITKYGNICGHMHTNESIHKRINSLIDSYGKVDHFLNGKESIEKRNNTKIEKYGSVMGQCHTIEATEKMRNTLLKSRSYKVFKYTLKGDMINEYEFLIEACKGEDLNNKSIVYNRVPNSIFTTDKSYSDTLVELSKSNKRWFCIKEGLLIYHGTVSSTIIIENNKRLKDIKKENPSIWYRGEEAMGLLSIIAK